MRKTIGTIGAVILACAASSVRAEVLPLGDNGFVVRHETSVAADAAQVWSALSLPSNWWDGAHTFSADSANLTLDARAGGCFCEVLPIAEGRAVAGSVRHMEVILSDPGTALRMMGALGPLQGEPVSAVMTITLRPIDGGTAIAAEYVVSGTMRFSRNEIAPAVDGVIAGQVGRLAKLLGVLGVAPAAVEMPPSAADGISEVGVAGPENASGFGEDFLDGVDGDEAR